MSDTNTEEDLAKSKWRRSPLIGWLIAVVPPLIYPFLMFAIFVPYSLFATPVEPPEYPSYPDGVKGYENLSPQQKQVYSRDLREYQEKIDKPYRNFYLGWIGVTVASLIACLGVYLISPLPLFNAWNILAGVTIAFIYTLLGFFMLIAWSFRHG